ncbi:Ldh family oxidoreductase [Bifidobacterium avesanii]|nr:Ldh family oxidoreductase [Bifidobacterium avesanii]
MMNQSGTEVLEREAEAGETVGASSALDPFAMEAAESAEARRRYDPAKLRELVADIMVAWGYTRAEGYTVADVLGFADLHGIDSHGLQRFQLYASQMGNKIDPHGKAEILLDTPVSRIIDGHRRMGQLNGVDAMNACIEKARTTGIGIASVRRSCHYGAAGYYASMAAKQGLIGISMTNTEPIVLPLYARQIFLGTNPIAVAIPADPHPFFFDASTSVVAYGKVELYAKQGKELPGTWVVDPENRPLTDSADALARLLRYNNEAGIVPVGGNTEYTGGHKGYGFSMLVEFFTAIVSGGATTDRTAQGDPVNGICHAFMAIDPKIYGDPEAVKARFSEYLDEVRALPAVPGRKVLVHGDKEAAALSDREASGVPLYHKTVSELRAIADGLGVDWRGALD